MVQPTQASISILSDKTEAAKYLVSSMNEKYTHYAKDKAINTMLKKLQYAIKTAIEKINEMKEDIMDDDMGRAQGPSRRRDFQDIPPQSRIMQNIVPDFRKLTSHPPGTKASVAQPMSSRNKENIPEKEWRR